MRGQVDDQVKMRRLLDMALDEGVQYAGFVCLMPLNDAARRDMIEEPDLTGPDMLRFETQTLLDCCRCGWWCYSSPKNEIMSFYVRHVLRPCENTGGVILYKNNTITPWYA